MVRVRSRIVASCDPRPMLHPVGRAAAGDVLAVVDALPDAVGQVLDERAAAGDAEQLQTAADGEDRHAAVERLAGDRQLDRVEPGPRRAELRVGLLAVGGRMDVRAAGEQQADAQSSSGSIVAPASGGTIDRHAAGLLDGLRVLQGQRDLAVGPLAVLGARDRRLLAQLRGRTRDQGTGRPGSPGNRWSGRGRSRSWCLSVFADGGVGRSYNIVPGVLSTAAAGRETGRASFRIDHRAYARGGALSTRRGLRTVRATRLDGWTPAPRARRSATGRAGARIRRGPSSRSARRRSSCSSIPRAGAWPTRSTG